MRFRRVTLKLQPPPPLHPLSARQYEALNLYGLGLEYEAIAARMECSYHTAKNLLTQARKKLNCGTSELGYIKLQRMLLKNG